MRSEVLFKGPRERMKSNYIRRLISLLLYGIIAFILVQAINMAFPLKTRQIVSENGVLDLSNWDSSDSESLTLSGEWEFYNKALLTKQSLGKDISGEIVNIPSTWNSYKTYQNDTRGFGYATYRLHVAGVSEGESLSLRIPPVSTAYRLYIDNNLLAGNGVVGTDKISSKPFYRVNIIDFMPDKNNFDIIIQVSNYTYARGGIWFSPVLGTTDGVNKLHKLILYRDIALISCFAMLMYHSLMLFIFRRKERSHLYFFIMCLTSIIRIILYSSYIVSYIPVLSNLEFVVRLDYLSATWLLVAFMLTSNEQFGNLIPRKIRQIVMSYICIFSASILLLPIYYFTSLSYFLHIIGFVLSVYILIKTIMLFIKRDDKITMLIVATIILFICSVHDLLMQNNLIVADGVEYFPAGIFLFVILEFYMLAKKSAMAMNEKEEALIKIAEMDKKEHETELKFLKAQIKPHFIHNALNAIIAISRTDSQRSRELLVDFSQYLRSCFDFVNLEDLIPIENELNLVYSYLAIEKARFGDNLEIHYDIDETDMLIPPLILQPLVENAVVHGIRKKKSTGAITVYIKASKEYITLGVKDNGIGLDTDKMNLLLDNSEESRGVGLYNINRRLNKMYHTSLVMENIENGGLNVYMNIPKEFGGN